MNRSEANQYCQSLGAQLFMPVSPSHINQARNFLLQQSPNLSSQVSGLWTGVCNGNNNTCKTIQTTVVAGQLSFDDVSTVVNNDDNDNQGPIL